MIRKILRDILETLRPLLGGDGIRSCRFTIGCTDFARIMLRDYPLHKAFWQITLRLISCSPLGNLLIRKRKR
jgi:putative component of membrane protein insertase Oxa1/YidC/SpoIIIJ protein YidD